MAKYSIELRALIETFGRDEVKSWFMDYNINDYLTQDEINVINERGTWSKERLAELILDHYYICEIGFETPALFKHYAKVAMCEIMEEKMPLIYSVAIKYDPLVNVDFTESYDAVNNATSTSRGNGLTINSDTPQGKISKNKILAGDYASNTSANENENSGKNDETQHYTKTTKGNSGISATAQKMIQQYRENIIMINRDIVTDLAKLFMGIY